MLFAVCCRATIRTVDNNPGAPNNGTTNFSSFGSAYSASSNNDTIFVVGSNTSYGIVSLSKPLVIIGTGHGPQVLAGKSNTLVSTFTEIHFNAGADNTKLVGLTIGIIYQDNSFSNCNNVIISRCRVTDRLDGGNWCNCRFPTCNNWIIEGSVFTNTTDCFGFANSSSSTPVVSTGLILRNNVFAGKLAFAYNSSGFQVYNNIFLRTSGADYFYNGGGVFQLYNNIFYSFIPNPANFNAFNNAVYYPSGGTFPGTGNVVYTATTQFFVSAAPGPFSYSNNYQIVGGSPLLTGGSGGAEQGAYGGTSQGVFTMSGAPAMPNMLQFITIPPNVTIYANAPLNVNIVTKRVQ